MACCETYVFPWIRLQENPDAPGFQATPRRVESAAQPLKEGSTVPADLAA